MKAPQISFTSYPNSTPARTPNHTSPFQQRSGAAHSAGLSDATAPTGDQPTPTTLRREQGPLGHGRASRSPTWWACPSLLAGAEVRGWWGWDDGPQALDGGLAAELDERQHRWDGKGAEEEHLTGRLFSDTHMRPA